MAAANTQWRGVASFGKRFLLITTTPFFPRSLSTPPPSSFRKCLHTSVYDKNVEEHVRPAVVPDEVIMQGGQPDKYWAPNPQTGVFGPASDPNADPAFHTSPATSGGGTHSVLEHKAFFRPLEDLDKPQHP